MVGQMGDGLRLISLPEPLQAGSECGIQASADCHLGLGN